MFNVLEAGRLSVGQIAAKKARLSEEQIAANNQTLRNFLSTKISCNDLTQFAGLKTEKYTFSNMCNNSTMY